VIVVELRGEPIGKGRPRFRVVAPKAGRSFVNAYTPAKTRAYERALALTAKVAMRGRPPILGPLAITVTAFMGVPTSWSNRKRDAALAGTVRPGRPDWDNIAKAAADALNSIVFADDSQIVEAKVSKLYDERPRLRVEICQLEVFAEPETGSLP
jgi:Holliday junction resolvase RusA-like endonuclease